MMYYKFTGVALAALISSQITAMAAAPVDCPDLNKIEDFVFFVKDNKDWINEFHPGWEISFEPGYSAPTYIIDDGSIYDGSYKVGPMGHSQRPDICLYHLGRVVSPDRERTIAEFQLTKSE